MRGGRTVAALPIALALAISACGGGVGTNAPGVTVTSAVSSTTTTPPVTTVSSTTTEPTTSAPTTTSATTTASPATTAGIGEAGPVYGTVEIDGVSLPPVPQAGEDSGIGRTIPSVTGHDFGGSPVSIGADGRAKMIVFLAHWCPHCQREMPIVQEWLATDPLPPGVDVYAVATLTRPDRDNFPPGPWFERNEWSAPVIVDDPFDSAATAFGLVAVPYWVIADSSGTVVARGSGSVPPEVLGEIARALAAEEAA